MPYRNYADPARLFVDQNPARTTATDSNSPLYNPCYYSIFQHNAGNTNSRVILCGFSFFDEINGLDPSADIGIDLDPAYAAPSKKVIRDPATGAILQTMFQVGFEEYLDILQRKGVNYLRIWLFSLDPTPYSPFQKISGKFDLSKLNNDPSKPKPYFQRLEQFVQLARDRGMVICLSLFSVQMIRPFNKPNHWWGGNPFNSAANSNGIIVGDDGNPAPEAKKLFCKIVKPGTLNGDAHQMQLYTFQKNLVTEVVNCTKPYWNVIYEMFNEPGTVGDTENFVIDNIIAWHQEAVKWIKDALTPDCPRLIAVTALDVLQPLLLDALNVKQNNVAGDIDLVGLHGNQWGGDSKSGPGAACNATAPAASAIVSGETTGDQKFHPGILNAIAANKDRRLALIFDTDAHYLAQQFPAPYLAESLKAQGNFNHRWSDTYLRQVDAHCTALTGDLFGLDDRMNKIFPPDQNPDLHNRITVFPKPPDWSPSLIGPQPVAAAGLYFYLDIAAPPAGKSADGYIAYFGWPDPNQQTR